MKRTDSESQRNYLAPAVNVLDIDTEAVICTSTTPTVSDPFGGNTELNW